MHIIFSEKCWGRELRLELWLTVLYCKTGRFSEAKQTHSFFLHKFLVFVKKKTIQSGLSLYGNRDSVVESRQVHNHPIHERYVVFFHLLLNLCYSRLLIVVHMHTYREFTTGDRHPKAPSSVDHLTVMGILSRPPPSMINRDSLLKVPASINDSQSINTAQPHHLLPWAPIYFDRVNISISSKKTLFFKEGGFDLGFFEGGDRRSLICALISYFCALFQVFYAFAVV